MRKASFVAVLGLLFSMLGGQPADARGKLTVINGTKYPAKVSIVYYTHLCKDDHPTVAAKGRWSVNSGLCEVKDSVVTLTDSNGKSHVCQGTRGHTNQAIWRVHTMNDPSELTQVKGISVAPDTKTPFCGIASA